MQVGVLACPHCRRVQTVELRFRHASCKECRKRVELRAARYFYRGESEQEARATVVRVSAQLGGMGIEEYAAVLQSLERESPPTLEDLVFALARGSAEFTPSEFANEMERLGLRGDPAHALAVLLGDNRVYEPRPGCYRLV